MVKTLKKKVLKKKKSIKKKISSKSFSKRYLRIFSRHPSHSSLRKKNGKGILCDDIAIARFGSSTKSKKKIQLNSIESISNSSNKYLMKRCFDAHSVKTSIWMASYEINKIDEEGIHSEELTIKFPFVAKNKYGSRGLGNTLINSKKKFDSWKQGRKINNYIFEKFYTYTKEYRLHVTKFGCFYTNRKLLKQSHKGEWFRNDSNSVWILETNPSFDRPSTWSDIEEHCMKAIKSVGLDFGACDVKVNKKGEFIVIETNSAPSFGKTTEEKYREILPKLVKYKMSQL